MSRVRNACEKAKIQLSQALSATIELEELHQGEDISIEITRAKFEDLCKEIWQRSVSPIDQVLDYANLTKQEIDQVVLVGGSSRIPKIQSLLEENFGNKINKSLNMDEAIAYGATVNAAQLSGQYEDI